jgi:hypothetical protein
VSVFVHPMGGDNNFKIRLGATKPPVGEAKAEIACMQGTEGARQELLYRQGGGASGRGSSSRGRCKGSRAYGWGWGLWYWEMGRWWRWQ